MLIERLSKESGLRPDRLRFFAKTASKRYFVFSVPKATGGFRQIAHPARPLKAVQRWLNSRYFDRLPVHDAAMAYRRGRSIRANAERHLNTRFTVRIDFKDFFPSFSVLHVYQFLKEIQKSIDASDEDVRFASQIVCRDDGLTIGAPTSPVLTNAMMASFDSDVGAYCAQRNLIYTRYADDIFISSSEVNVLSDAFSYVKEAAAKFPYANLKINSRKTAFLSKKYHRAVTGLVLTSDNKISIGRAKKREIKALIHQFLTGELTMDRMDYLRGYLSFVSDVEPNFMNALVTKYGDGFMTMLYYRSEQITTSFNLLEALDPDAD